MRLVLKDFQTDVVENLLAKLRLAAREANQSRELQAVGLSAPTGSGKTVMVTAAMERLLQGDDENQPIPDAAFLWITDQPQLNEQTRRKMLKDSSLFTEANLVTIGTAFDQESFTGGTVNFLNIQKLSKGSDLTTNGDSRRYTIWETISNTVDATPDRFFVIIDEAHRGMSEDSQARKDANTIIQKFIKGSAGEIPKVPLILGISATLDRFNRLVGGTGRTMRSIDVPIEEVRGSGLLKETVTLYHPTTDRPTDISMLRWAAQCWRDFRDAWKRYCEDEGELEVKPILVVQVQDAAGRRVSKTDLDEAVQAIEEELGGLPAIALAHAFQEGGPVTMNGREIRYLAPADIDGDPDVQVVFFKTSLNSGWDCPRAEAMMSFRTSVDPTAIAQLVGRMVRNPLARLIDSSDLLNRVSLYLPHYDKNNLDKVIKKLTEPDPDILPPVGFQRGENLTRIPRASLPDSAFETIERLPTYIIPTRRKTSQVRRLMKLARALGNDEIDPNAEGTALAELIGVLQAEYDRMSSTETFVKLVDERKEVTIRAVDWQVGIDAVERDKPLKLAVSSENIDDVFEDAGRRIGDEGLHKEWWRTRRRRDIDNTRAKLELVALAIDPGVRKKLESTAQREVQTWLRAHQRAIDSLPERRQQVYNDIRSQALDPELRAIHLPADIEATKTDPPWKSHIYANSGGNYPTVLNTWEAAVVTDELARDAGAVWLRNTPRKPWAITIPYRESGQIKGFYPDFVFLTQQNGEWIPSLLDPHSIDLPDAPAKAVGLAEYAAKHYLAYNRIELIIVRDDDICRIDLGDEAKRQKVLPVTTRAHLEHLFEEFA